jgi:hypothetical protein
MARTKQEVRNFLNSQVGKKVNAKAGIYNGQCVSLIKALLEYLGVPNPYAARGNAKDVGDTLVRQDIAERGKGWLTVAVNRSMGNIGGVTYGHIWLDLTGEANFEQNGARALHTTKNTRPISQAQQLVNLDKWIKADAPKPQPKPPAAGAYRVNKTLNGYYTAADAKNRKNPRVKVAAGNYHVFNKANNMINVTKKAGVPGSWINPADNGAAAPAPAKKYVTVQRGWGLSNVARAAGFKDYGSEARWAAIAKLNGSGNWRAYNNSLKPNQKVRVK